MDSIVTFSVIIPAYNVEPYLARCMDSVLPALLANDEVILSIEDSTDKSNEIAQQYAREHDNVRAMRHDVKGLSNARNYARERAKGTYIVYIDGDDRVDTAAFIKALQDIREDGKKQGTPADMYMYDFYCDNCLTRRLEPHFQIGESGEIKGINDICKVVKRSGSFWNAWRFIYRRDFLTDNAITFPENRLCEDIDHTTSVLLARPNTVFRHDPFYIYTQYRGGSIMNNVSLKRFEDVIYILEQSVQKMRDAKLAYSACVINKYQWEYIWNAALIYELPKAEREAASRLYTDAADIVLKDVDAKLRPVAGILKTAGAMPISWALHILKQMKYRKMKRVGEIHE